MQQNFVNLNEDAEDLHFQGESEALLKIKKVKLEKMNKRAKNAK